MWDSLIGAFIGGAASIGAAVWTLHMSFRREETREQALTGQKALLDFLEWHESQAARREADPVGTTGLAELPTPGAAGLRVVMFTDGLASRILLGIDMAYLNVKTYIRRGHDDLAEEAARQIRTALRLAARAAQHELSPSVHPPVNPAEAQQVNDMLTQIIQKSTSRRRQTG